MDIQPYVGDIQVTASSVVVKVNPDDRQRAQQLCARTQTLTVVNDQESFLAAKRLAGEAKAMLDEIESAKKASKQPFLAVGRAIDALVIDVGTPVMEEHRRILSLLNGYVAEMERKAKEEARRKAEAERIQKEAFERALAEAAAKASEAELKARLARDEVEKANAQKDAAERRAALLQAQLERDMAEELSLLGNNKPKVSLVTGGRVDHPYKFQLDDIQAVVHAGHWRLVKWSLDVRACQDAVRSQLERFPDREPTLAGITITQEINVSVRATSRTE